MFDFHWWWLTIHLKRIWTIFHCRKNIVSLSPEKDHHQETQAVLTFNIRGFPPQSKGSWKLKDILVECLDYKQNWTIQWMNLWFMSLNRHYLLLAGAIICKHQNNRTVVILYLCIIKIIKCWCTCTCFFMLSYPSGSSYTRAEHMNRWTDHLLSLPHRLI